jgi:hypothetical protein
MTTRCPGGNVPSFYKSNQETFHCIAVLGVVAAGPNARVRISLDAIACL